MQMMLGTFLFGFSTASYQTLSRTSPRRIAESQRVGATTVLQDIGNGVETLKLPGVIMPALMGTNSIVSLDKLRAMQDTGAAHLLMQVDPDAWAGTMAGSWMIENIEETQSHFFGALPQKIEFTLSLKRQA